MRSHEHVTALCRRRPEMIQDCSDIQHSGSQLLRRGYEQQEGKKKYGRNVRGSRTPPNN
jgi:hypothetical protein